MHYLVRACQNRITGAPQANLLDVTRDTPCLFQCTVNVRARTAKLVTETRKRQQTRGARIAEIEVRATTVTVEPPYRPKGSKLAEVTLNVVLAERNGNSLGSGGHIARWTKLQ